MAIARTDKGSCQGVRRQAGELLRIDAKGSVLRLHGEIDLATAPQLADALREALCAPGDRLVLDFADVTFIDAFGLGVLVQTQSRLHGNGNRSITVRSSSPRIHRLFEIMDLADFFDDN
jgi:anti-anti-sigma factor